MILFSTIASVAPRDGDFNRSSWLLPVFWTEVGIAIVVVALRFYTQYVRRSTGADDWTMLVSLVNAPDEFFAFFDDHIDDH